MSRTAFCLLILLSHSAMAATDKPADLFQLIDQRLKFMKDVACYKARHHLPVEDVAREDQVLRHGLQQASRAGFAGDEFRLFLQVQMSAAKAVQYRMRAELEFLPAQRCLSPELSVTRQKISALDDRILRHYAALQHAGGHISPDDFQRFEQILDTRYLKHGEKYALFIALMHARLEPQAAP
ncbi:gamma subclass chorismate mutase AroQ [Acerihabitans arboris]|uniref:chorismate mutase n=1 Tax=Acerihabitans arboris TaxID=2691583 RepID=A0A845SIJ4_9GAMM|nr:gamma subclass chorismate mutase AroQ [Acerihabitans arboris]NDL62784.1 gamma subclass chorismate mutase AroQ [Acerihabitans arboris]